MGHGDFAAWRFAPGPGRAPEHQKRNSPCRNRPDGLDPRKGSQFTPFGNLTFGHPTIDTVFRHVATGPVGRGGQGLTTLR